jgi:hypothetical protein
VCGQVDSCASDSDNDADSDMICGDVDSCTLDALNDADSDALCGQVDSCPFDLENDAEKKKTKSSPIIFQFVLYILPKKKLKGHPNL